MVRVDDWWDGACDGASDGVGDGDRDWDLALAALSLGLRFTYFEGSLLCRPCVGRFQ